MPEASDSAELEKSSRERNYHAILTRFGFSSAEARQLSDACPGEPLEQLTDLILDCPRGLVVDWRGELGELLDWLELRGPDFGVKFEAGFQDQDHAGLLIEFDDVQHELTLQFVPGTDSLHDVA